MFPNRSTTLPIPGSAFAGWRIAFVALLLSLCAESTRASGISGSLPQGRPGVPARQVDQAYEYGKALYLGRAPEAHKLKYCLNVDGEAKKIGRRSLRPWRGKPQLEFANALYDCDSPDQRVLLKLEQEQVAYVLYYLNKRFKLDLQIAGE